MDELGFCRFQETGEYQGLIDLSRSRSDPARLPVSLPGTSGCGFRFTQDITGDGLPDLVWHLDDGDMGIYDASFVELILQEEEPSPWAVMPNYLSFLFDGFTRPDGDALVIWLSDIRVVTSAGLEAQTALQFCPEIAELEQVYNMGLHNVGDLDGDGIDEMMIEGVHEMRVLNGAHPYGSPLYKLETEPVLGWTVARGDLDGDGREDAMLNFGAENSSATVYLRTSGL